MHISLYWDQSWQQCIQSKRTMVTSQVRELEVPRSSPHKSSEIFFPALKEGETKKKEKRCPSFSKKKGNRYRLKSPLFFCSFSPPASLIRGANQKNVAVLQDQKVKSKLPQSPVGSMLTLSLKLHSMILVTFATSATFLWTTLQSLTNRKLSAPLAFVVE